jgi:hypothetical protein
MPCRFTPVTELKPTSTEMVVSLAEHAAGVWAEPNHPGWFVTQFDSQEAASGNLVPVSNASDFVDGAHIFMPQAEALPPVEEQVLPGAQPEGPTAEQPAAGAREASAAGPVGAPQTSFQQQTQEEVVGLTPLTPSKRGLEGSSSSTAGSLRKQARGSEMLLLMPPPLPAERPSAEELRSYSQALLATTQQPDTEQQGPPPAVGALAPQPPSPAQPGAGAVMLPIGMPPARMGRHFAGAQPPHPQPPPQQQQQQQEEEGQQRSADRLHPKSPE